MKISLKLTSPLFKDAAIKAALSRLVKVSALELKSDIVINLQQNAGNAAGKTYRRGKITRSASKTTKALDLKHFVTKTGKERAITGYTFHRASAKGQSPAIDTGGLIGSVAAADLAELKSRVSVGKKYGQRLDDPNGLNRPFFRVRVVLFKPKFKAKVLEVLKGS